MTRLDRKSDQKATEDKLRSLRLPSRLGTPRHRPSWLFRLRLLQTWVFRTRGSVIALLLAAVAILASRGWNLTESLNSESLNSANGVKNEAVQSETTSANQSVTLHIAEFESVRSSLTLTGTVIPRNLSNVSPTLSGLQISEMRVESGDRVSPGQVLAVLDNSVLQAQLKQAEANLAQAQTELQQQAAALTQAQVLQQAAIVDMNRYGSLFEAGAISEEQLGNRQIQALTTRQQVEVVASNLESARSNIDSKAADIERIKALMAQTLITTPVAGTIAERFATAGDAASAGDPLYSLIEAHQLTLKLHPNQDQLPNIEPGMPVTISAVSNDEPSLSLTGRIDTIEPTLDAQSRQATVKVSLPELSDRLRPGMFLQAKIITGQRRSIVVPADAVVTQPDGQALVFTADKATANRVRVEANAVEVADRSGELAGSSDSVEILSGLSAGSQVVIGGASYLQAGDVVAVIAENSSEQ
ncbi:MAG: efflux RND transporter periplasmic adaptor subunit [Cyanobacteria bacterium J06627_28]